MSTRERPIDRGRRLARVDLLRIGSEIRIARSIVGRSLEDIGPASGMSPSQAGRIERGCLTGVGIDQLARLGACVGLDVRVRAYPGPDPVIDAGQSALMMRLGARLHPSLRLRTEVPLPIVGDQRAWDGMIIGLPEGPDRAAKLPVEAETRLIDIQAQLRRITLKLRDAQLDHVLLIVADTRRNRDAIAGAGLVLGATFPVSARRAMRALSEGRHPGGSAIVLL